MPPELTRLRSLLVGGLSATAALWAPVEAAYAWVFRAAAVLANVFPVALKVRPIAAQVFAIRTQLPSVATQVFAVSA